MDAYSSPNEGRGERFQSKRRVMTYDEITVFRRGRTENPSN
jgi:hypothetical protein